MFWSENFCLMNNRWILYFSRCNTCCYSCDSESERPIVTCGEPQGSTLGPLGFNIEMLWLVHIVQNNNINDYDYTDDTSVRELHQWMTGWLLTELIETFSGFKHFSQINYKTFKLSFKNSKYHIQSELREQRSEDTKQVSGQWTGFQSERFKMLLDYKSVSGWAPTKHNKCYSCFREELFYFFLFVLNYKKHFEIVLYK